MKSKVVLSLVAVTMMIVCMIMAPKCLNSKTSGFSVLLVDDPIDGLTGMWVTISSIEVYPETTDGSEAEPIALALNPDVAQPVNLLALQNGVFAELVSGSDNANKLPAGVYSNMKIYLASAALTFTDDPTEVPTPATVPPDKFNVSGPFTVADGSLTEIYLVFNAHNSLHQNGKGEYIIHPSLKLMEKIVSGSVAGLVSPAPAVDPATGIQTEVKIFADKGTQDEAWTVADSTGAFALIPLREGTHTITVQWVTLQDTNADGALETIGCLSQDAGQVTVTAEQATDMGTITLAPDAPACL